MQYTICKEATLECSLWTLVVSECKVAGKIESIFEQFHAERHERADVRGRVFRLSFPLFTQARLSSCCHFN